LYDLTVVAMCSIALKVNARCYAIVYDYNNIELKITAEDGSSILESELRWSTFAKESSLRAFRYQHRLVFIVIVFTTSILL
jgi:hypothetical protein